MRNEANGTTAETPEKKDKAMSAGNGVGFFVRIVADAEADARDVFALVAEVKAKLRSIAESPAASRVAERAGARVLVGRVELLPEGGA